MKPALHVLCRMFYPVDSDYTPIRSGLRERKRADSPKQREPSMTEEWFPEEKLELWEIKYYGEK